MKILLIKGLFYSIEERKLG